MAIINCPECQKDVSESAASCPYCGYGVKKHFDDIIFAERRKQRNKILKILIPSLLIAFTLSTTLIINHSILSNRTTFNNKAEMLEYLSEQCTWKLDNKYRNEWLVFYDTGLGEQLSDDGSFDKGELITMNPKRGLFELGITKYVILNNGDIAEYNKEFEDERYKPSYFTSDFETVIKGLNLEVLSFDASPNNGTLEATVKVTNKGKKTYSFVYLETTLSDNEGNTYTLDDFEIVVPDGENNNYEISPGKTGTCSIFATNIPSKYHNYSIKIKEYRTPIKIN